MTPLVIWMIGVSITGASFGHLVSPAHGWLFVGIALMATGVTMWLQSLPPSTSDGYDY